ncbi:MAG: hypothetical protein ABIA12_00485 [Candidatus Aenigmatarchaeota archaeon]
MRSSSSSRSSRPRQSNKAQFLVITAFVMVSIFYLVSKWMQPYTIPDTSEIVLAEEPFVFNNVKEKALYLVNTSSSCEELVYNLQEFKSYVEDYAFRKLIVYFDYTLETPCYTEDPDFPFPVLVLFDIRVQSQTLKAADKFYGYWPPGTGP